MCCDVVPGSEVSLRHLLEHRLLLFNLGEKFLEAGVLLFQLGHPLGFLSLCSAVLLLSAVISRLGDLNGGADIGNCLALGVPLLKGFELANDLLGCVADSFHGEVPGPV